MNPTLLAAIVVMALFAGMVVGALIYGRSFAAAQTDVPATREDTTRTQTVCGFEPPYLVVEAEARFVPPLRNEVRCVVCVEARRAGQTVDWA